MLIRGGGAAGTADVHLAIVQAQRGTVRTAREVDEAAAEKRLAAQREAGDQRIKQMEEQLAAAESSFFSFLGGAVLGVVSGFSMGLGAALGGPLLGGSLLIPLGGATMTGAAGGLTLGGAGNTLFKPLTVYHENNASDAELRVAELEQQVALLESESKDADVDIDRARRLIKDVRGVLADLKRYEREQKIGESEGAVAGGSAAATPEMQEALRALRRQQEEAAYVLRSQSDLAKDLHIAALAQKRAAIAERKSNAVGRALFGIVELAAQVAGAVATGGGLTVLGASANLTSATGGLAEALIDDGASRAMDRKSEGLTLEAKKAEAKADETREEQATLDAALEQGKKAVLDSKAKAKGDRPVAGGPASGGVIAAQRVVAQLATEEERSAKIDRKNARGEEQARAKEAILERVKADQEQANAEALNLMLAGIGAGMSAFNFEVTSLKKAMPNPKIAATLGDLSAALSDADTVQQGLRAGAGVYKFSRDEDARDLRTQGEQLDVQSRVAGDDAEDATERREEAKDRRQRALDLAVAAGRGSAAV